MLGAAWLSAATLANGLIGAVVNIFLARRLGPLLIGTYALAIAVSDLAALLIAWGVDTYLVQSPDDDREQFGTALSFTLILGGAFLGLTAALVPVFLWRRQPLVAALLVGLAAQRLLLLNSSCYGALLQRRFQFGRLALIQIVTGIIEHIAAVAVALAGGGVWALLARDMLDPLGGLVGGRLISKRPYRLQWRPAVARRMRRFGVAILLGQSGELASHKLDSALLGLVWGTRELAFYEEAFKLADVTRRVSQPALSQVALPSYARLRTDRVGPTGVFRRVQTGGILCLTPVCLALVVLPEPLVRLLFGTQWLGAVPMVRAFAGYAMLAPLFEHFRQLLLAQGAPGAVARAKLVQLVVFLPALAALLGRWGGEGTALAVDAGMLGALVVAALAARSYLAQGDQRRLQYGPPALAALVAGAAVIGIAARAGVFAQGAVLLLSYGSVLALCYYAPLRSRWARRSPESAN